MPRDATLRYIVTPYAMPRHAAIDFRLMPSPFRLPDAASQLLMLFDAADAAAAAMPPCCC